MYHTYYRSHDCTNVDEFKINYENFLKNFGFNGLIVFHRENKTYDKVINNKLDIRNIIIFYILPVSYTSSLNN